MPNRTLVAEETKATINGVFEISVNLQQQIDKETEVFLQDLS